MSAGFLALPVVLSTLLRVVTGLAFLSVQGCKAVLPDLVICMSCNHEAATLMIL